MFYIVRPLVCDMTWTELCDCWKIAFRWDVVNVSLLKDLQHVGGSAVMSLLVQQQGLSICLTWWCRHISPSASGLAAATTSVPPRRTSFQPSATSFTAAVAGFLVFTAHFPGPLHWPQRSHWLKWLKKESSHKREMARQRFKCLAAYLAHSLAVQAHFREEQDKINVNVQYLIIGTHKPTMSNFRSIIKNKKIKKNLGNGNST